MRLLKCALLALFLGAPVIGCSGDTKPTVQPAVETGKDGKPKPGKPHPPAPSN